MLTSCLLALVTSVNLNGTTGGFSAFGHAFENRYFVMEKGKGDVTALEREDVVEKRIDGKGFVAFRCTNPKMPDVTIVKRYAVDETRGRVRRELAFRNAAKATKFVTPFVECSFAAGFKTNLYHLGAGYIGPYKPFPDVTAPRPVNDYKQSSKGLVFIHPDGTVGNLSHFRTKIDDTVVLPWWHSTIGHYREFHDRLWYLPNGYRMGLGTFALVPAKTVTVTDRFDAFDGDLFTFFDEIFAKDPDVARELASIPKPPAWIRDIYANTHDDFDDFYHRWLVEMTDEGILMPISCLLYSWGDYRFANGFPTSRGGFVTGPEAKAFVDYQKGWSPRIRPCWYNIVISTSSFTDVFRDHPDWFRTRDREGNLDSLFPGLSRNWQTMFDVPACRAWMVDMLAREADDFGLDIIYLDEFQMTNTIDWERGRVTTDADTVRFWKALSARLSREGKMLFANGSGSPYVDVNYMESPHEMAPERWRDWVGVALGIGMINRLRPGQRTSPLYWAGTCDYANRILALGWLPATTYNCANLPVMRAAWQYGNMLPIDAKYAPDWKTDPKVDVESHSVRRDDARDVVLSFINRAAAPADVPVAIRLDTLGFAATERVNVWRLHYDPKLGGARNDEIHSDAELKRNWREKGALRYARVTDPELVYSGSAKGTFACTLEKLGVNRMDQFLVTAAPVSLFAENGLPLSVFATAQRQARIDGRRVHVNRSADILLADRERDFADVTANGSPVATRRIRLAGGLVGTLVSLGKGDWQLAWRTVARSDGANEKVALPTPLPMEKTKVRLPKPAYAPEEREIRDVGRRIGDVTLARAAVYRSKCETSFKFQPDVPLAALSADPTNLVLTAGTSRREARVRTMECFSGFEFTGARQLKLRLTHTFGEARSVALGHVTKYGPGASTEIFAGLVVDFSVAGKYAKRVSLAAGLYSPHYAVARPDWGTGRAPDEQLELGDWIDGAKDRTFSLDLAKLAPKGWDGRAFVSLGTCRVECGRSLTLSILGFNETKATDFVQPVRNVEARVMPPPLRSKPLKAKPKSLEKIDFAEWQAWGKVGSFMKLGEGRVKEQTRVYVAHDYEYLYVGIDADQAEGVRTGDSVPWQNDHAEVVLVRPDGILYQAGADVKGRTGLFLQRRPANAARIRTRGEVVPKKGWRLFMALPIDDLKFDMQRTPVTIRADFCRVRREPSEASSWTPLTKDFFERGHYGTVILDFNW